MKQLVVSEFWKNVVHEPTLSEFVAELYASVGLLGAEAAADREVKHGLAVWVTM